MNKHEELDKLIVKYNKLNEELTNYTDEYYDAALCDINGYRESYYEYEDEPVLLDEDIKDIKKQISAFTSILNGHKKLKYKYG